MMSLVQTSLLQAYYHSTVPLRVWRNRSFAAAGMAPAMMLMYHRVADDLSTPWTVTDRMFVRQIEWLQQHFELVSMAEVQRRVRRRMNRRPCVSITFDDGYADNCHAAMPLLIKKQIPCTYFVTTKNILGQVPFAHDLALGVRSAVNTPEQIRALADAGVEIAAHTKTHADLGAIENIERLEDEIIGGAEQLSEISCKPVRFFAFPFGQHPNLSQAAYDVCRRAGFEGLCSAYGGYNMPGDDPFHLQRIAIGNDLIRLKNWVTFDPRKPRITPAYRFHRAESTVGSDVRRESIPSNPHASSRFPPSRE